MPAVAQELPQLEFEVNALVYEDVNMSTDHQTPEEPQLAGSTIEVYDSDFNLLGEAVSSDTAPTSLQSNFQIQFVCIVPQSGWIQTSPVSAFGHPSDVSWYCHEYSQETEVYEFGIVKSTEEPEPIPTIIRESESESDPKVPPVQTAVLGANTDELLAETGTPTLAVSVIGIWLLLSVITLAQISKLD